jgi:GT2 family glycosyltransferase
MNGRDSTQLIERLSELETARRRVDELEQAYVITEQSFFARVRTFVLYARGLVAPAKALASRPWRRKAIARAFGQDGPKTPTDVKALQAEIYRLEGLVATLSHRTDAPSDDPYQRWLAGHGVRHADVAMMYHASHVLEYQPTISVLMPTYDTQEKLLHAAIESVIAQAYPFWELCIADDASTNPRIRSILEHYARNEPRIKLAFRKENGHISRATNTALELATGEYIALFDHDDLLTRDALFLNVLELNRDRTIDMLYSDEDKVLEDGTRFDPFFKQDWCPDSFLSRMYTCHLGVYRTSIARQIGGFRVGFEGSQDYDFVLRFTEKTQAIKHIPRVLYNWRVHAGSTAASSFAKPYASDAARRAISEAIARRGEPGTVEVADVPGVYIVRYDLKTKGRISIIVPTRNHGDDVDRCLSSIFNKPSYQNFEVLLVDNGSDELASLQTFKRWAKKDSRVRIIRDDGAFNFSRINNDAVRQATGEFLLFLNNDTEAITKDWLRAMLEQAQRPSIGIVGALLLYPDDTIQHAGVIVGLGGVAGHSHKHFPGDHPGYFSMLRAVVNYSAVTAACIMLRREVFEEVGGFDETLAIAFNDVDLCLKVAAAGYRNLYLPHAQLYHFESKSRGHENTPDKQARFTTEIDIMQARWNTAGAPDPCYSPNLTLAYENFAIRA